MLRMLCMGDPHVPSRSPPASNNPVASLLCRLSDCGCGEVEYETAGGFLRGTGQKSVLAKDMLADCKLCRAGPGLQPMVRWPGVQVAEAVVAAYDSGELQRAVAGADEAFKGWVKALGKAQKRKGKRLFMPLRLALTGSTHVRSSSFYFGCRA